MNDEEPVNGELGLLSVGDRLREAREAKKLSIDDIGNSTRISLRHLRSLEEGRYSDMPGRTYTVGFARAYAKTVELPESEWLDLLREELDYEGSQRPSSPMLNSDVEDSGKVPSRKTAWIIAAVGIAAVVLGYVAWRSTAGFTSSPDIASSASADNSAAVEQIASVDLPPSGVPVAAGSDLAANVAGDAPVVFTATEDRIWVKFYDGNGDQLMQKEMKLGETYTVPQDAQGPQLATARPDALSITVAGQVIAPLGTAERVIRDVPVDPKSLLGRSETPEQ